MKRIWPQLIAVMLLLASCGTGDPEATPAPDDTTAAPEGQDARGVQLIVLPGEDGQLPDDVQVGCRSGPTFPASALASVAPVDAPEYGFVAEAIAPFLTSGEGAFWPQTGWQVLHETDEQVLIVHMTPAANPEESGVSFMTVELREGLWRWSGSSASGPCELTTKHPDGLNRVEWRLDPQFPPQAESAQFAVLATELECASGRPMGTRLLDPDVVVTDDAVFIAFAALPDGADAHDCQGNPEVLVTVELPEPLGERQILDGLTVAGFLSDYIGNAFS